MMVRELFKEEMVKNDRDKKNRRKGFRRLFLAALGVSTGMALGTGHMVAGAVLLAWGLAETIPLNNKDTGK